MGHYTSFLASLASLVLMAAVYYCNYISSENSWLRSGTLQMILLSLLTGIFCLAVPATIIGVLGVATGGLSLSTITNSGLELASIAMIVVTVALFRNAVQRTNRAYRTPHNVTPLTPRPAAPNTGRGSLKKAA